MIDSTPLTFKQRFDLGVNCYIKGKWGDSRLQYLLYYIVYVKH